MPVTRPSSSASQAENASSILVARSNKCAGQAAFDGRVSSTQVRFSKSKLMVKLIKVGELPGREAGVAASRANYLPIRTESTPFRHLVRGARPPVSPRRDGADRPSDIPPSGTGQSSAHVPLDRGAIGYEQLRAVPGA